MHAIHNNVNNKKKEPTQMLVDSMPLSLVNITHAIQKLPTSHSACVNVSATVKRMSIFRQQMLIKTEFVNFLNQIFFVRLV